MLLLAQADSRDFVKYCCITNTSVVNQPCFVLSDGFYISEAGMATVMKGLDESNNPNEKQVLKDKIEQYSRNSSRKIGFSYLIRITDRDILHLQLHIQQVRENNILRKRAIEVIGILMLGTAVSYLATPLALLAICSCMMGISKINGDVK